jgi:peptidoglycan/xylan/chitin deacetylase (PgdA/CDA1 family)
MRLCAVSVDLDEVPCYTAIHGLPAPSGAAAHAIYRQALPRLADLFAELQLPATFFACGRDLREADAAAALRRLAASGHEIGNHSLDHPYDLTRLPRAEMRAQVEDGARSIGEAIGRAPQGFRAPGYTITDELFEVLSELGVGYDSSVWPCPAYFAAKAAAISGYRLLGRPSRSILDHPRVLSAPSEPYRIGRPYTRKGAGLLELPIGVTRLASGRLPYIGTFVLANRISARWLTRGIIGRQLVNLELHGIDAADAELDGLGDLRRHQPDLRLSAAAKLANLREAIAILRAHDYVFVTLDDAARRFTIQLESLPS